MPKDGLTFVSLSGDTTRDTQTTNKLVRAHVMRRYKRQQKSNDSKNKPPRSDGTGTSEAASSARSPVSCQSPICYSFSPHSSGRQSQGQNQDLTTRYKRTRLENQLDPFSSLPIFVDRRMLLLLQQSAAQPIRTSVHADPSCQYRNICSKDPAWLFMHLYYAACRFWRASGETGTCCEATDYHLRSVSAVNGSIEKSPNAVEDSTIATVACLANIENMTGDLSSALVHAEGLKRMVEMRGGLSELGMGGIVRRMVLWSDLLTSINCRTPPCFPFTTTTTGSLFQLWEFTPAFPRSKYWININEGLETITTMKHRFCFSRLLLSLHELITFLNFVGKGPLPWDACYPDRVYEVEYGLHASLFDDMVIAECTEKVTVGHLLLHAALLFIYSNLRDMPVDGRIRKALLSRLCVALDGVDLLYLPRGFEAEMLWVMAVGTSAANGPVRARFTEDAESLCMEYCISTWEEVVELFHGVPALLDANMETCMASWALDQLP